jgi:hypothetical protein
MQALPTHIARLLSLKLAPILHTEGGCNCQQSIVAVTQLEPAQAGQVGISGCANHRCIGQSSCSITIRAACPGRSVLLMPQ